MILSEEEQKKAAETTESNKARQVYCCSIIRPAMIAFTEESKDQRLRASHNTKQ